MAARQRSREPRKRSLRVFQSIAAARPAIGSNPARLSSSLSHTGFSPSARITPF